MKRLLLSVMGFFLITTTAFAGHPLVTDDTGTQGKGKAQIEVGLSFFSDKGETDEQTTLKSEGGDLTVGITVGLLDTLDVVVGLPYAWNTSEEKGLCIDRADGISDITFDVKWRFLEKNGWSLALKPGFSIPSGDEDKGFASEITGFRFFLIGTKEFEPFAVHINTGLIRNENNLDDCKNLWHTSIACEIEVIKNLKLLANIGMERNTNSISDKHPAFALGGISYDVSEKFALDAGVKYGLTSTETDWTVLTGLTMRF